MILLVGLGNPGEKYRMNRHNVGFQILDAIADHYNFNPERKKFQGIIREGVLDGHGLRQKAVLLKPVTFYNESGNAVREAAQFYKIPLEKIYVFHDEIDLAPGKLKVKTGGSAAGNNGIKSIIAHLGQDFARIRVGVGHPGDKSKVTQHVLNDFSKHDHQDWLDDTVYACVKSLPLLASREEGLARFLSDVALSLRPPQAVMPKIKDQSPAAQNSPPVEAVKKQNNTTEQPKEQSPFALLKGLLNKE